MTSTPSFSYPFSVEKLSVKGTTVKITGTAEDCARLAQDFDVPEIKSFKAELYVQKKQSHIVVSGDIKAVVVQKCGGSLELFESTINEQIEAEFVNERTHSEKNSELEQFNEFDLIKSGHIDLGALAAEFLALGLDPFARKPGVEFSYIEDDTKESPFACLDELK